jgi:hypothetical protein
LATDGDLEQKASIIDIIQNKYPSLPTAAQPVVHELKYIGSRILSTRDLGAVCNFAVALLEPGGVACMNPEHPRLACLFSDAVGIFHS